MMKRVFSLLPAILLASLLTTAVVSAHHSFTMFDRSIEKVVTGTVTRWTFNSPHSWLYLNIKDKDVPRNNTQTVGRKSPPRNRNLESTVNASRWSPSSRAA